MSLVSIGPIVIGEYEHGNPSWSWGAGGGNRPFSISGLLTWTHCEQLDELVYEGSGRVTIEGATGRLERIEYSGDLFASRSGLYVLAGFNSDPSKAHTMSPETCPFSLTGIYLGGQA